MPNVTAPMKSLLLPLKPVQEYRKYGITETRDKKVGYLSKLEETGDMGTEWAIKRDKSHRVLKEEPLYNCPSTTFPFTPASIIPIV